MNKELLELFRIDRDGSRIIKYLESLPKETRQIVINKIDDGYSFLQWAVIAGLLSVSTPRCLGTK